MVLRINPSRMPVWVRPDQLQVGAGKTATRTTSLSPGQQRLVQLLMRGVADEALPAVLEELHVSSAESDSLLIELESNLIRPELGPAPLDRQYVERNFAELCRVQATHNVEGTHVVARRAAASVFVDEGSTGDFFANALATSGIGTVQRAGDARNLQKLDAAITVDHSTYRPISHRRWLALAVPQVAILFDQSGVSISPLIEVGVTPCLSCLTISSESEEAIAVDTQLLFSSQRFDDSVCKNFAVAIAAQTVLNHIDAANGFDLPDFRRCGYRLDSATGRVFEVTWQFSESCLCHL